MYCTKCGTSRPDGMTACASCGTVTPIFAAQPKIQNYLLPSILITLCCCVPAGIVAIVYAAQVNAKLAAGNIHGAQESARLARIWCWVGFGCGVVIGLIYAVIGFADAFGNHH